MGNRIQGFLGGVLVAGFLTVTTNAAIKRTEQVNSGHLRQCNDYINNRILSDKYASEAAVPVNKRVSTTHRPSVVETCKDIWNDEIIKMTNRVYSINWYQWGLDIDRKVNKLTDKLVSSAVEKK